MGRPKKYPDELLQRGVRLALEGERPIAHIAHDLGIHPETLRKKVRQAEADSGARPELTNSSEREELKRLRRENYELRRANEILKAASSFFASMSRLRGPAGFALFFAAATCFVLLAARPMCGPAGRPGRRAWRGLIGSLLRAG